MNIYEELSAHLLQYKNSNAYCLYFGQHAPTVIVYCGWLYFLWVPIFMDFTKMTHSWGSKFCGHSIFFNNSYRKWPFGGYWNLCIGPSTKTTKIGTPRNLSHPQYFSGNPVTVTRSGSVLTGLIPPAATNSSFSISRSKSRLRPQGQKYWYQ